MRRFPLGLAISLAALSSALADDFSGPPRNTVICQGGGTSVTGTLTKTSLASCTVPANAMGAKGRIEISAIWSYTNSANAKNLRIDFGSLASGYLVFSPTTSSELSTQTTIQNLTTSSQTGAPATIPNIYAVGTGSLAVSTYDTTQDTPIAFNVTLTNVGETVTLVSYIVKLFPSS